MKISQLFFSIINIHSKNLLIPFINKTNIKYKKKSTYVTAELFPGIEKYKFAASVGKTLFS